MSRDTQEQLVAADEVRRLEETDSVGCQRSQGPCVGVDLNSDRGRRLRQEETGRCFIWCCEGFFNTLLMAKHSMPLIVHVF